MLNHALMWLMIDFTLFSYHPKFQKCQLPVFLEPSLSTWHIFHAIGTIMTVNLMRDTETTSNIQTMTAEIKFTNWLQCSTTTFESDQILDLLVKWRSDAGPEWTKGRHL